MRRGSHGYPSSTRTVAAGGRVGMTAQDFVRRLLRHAPVAV
jgi:hypothetical protein